MFSITFGSVEPKVQLAAILTNIMNQRPFFSIVIPTLNEEKSLPQLLTDLTTQTFTDFEVIHVDGRSEDKTLIKAAAFSDRLELKTINAERRNVSYQRNLGGQAADGKWLIFMDADNRLPTYFLDGIKYQIHKLDQIDIFTTWVTTDEKARSQPIANIINLGLELYNILHQPSAFGAMIGIKRKIFAKIKFDEKQLVLEDSFFVRQVVKTGYQFCLLREPRYQYSLRRLRHTNALKLATSTARMQLKALQNKSFHNQDLGYTMAGGQQFESTPSSTKLPFLENIQVFVEKATKKQLDQARQILDQVFKNQSKGD